MSRVLVTGGAGAIGSQLVRDLSRQHQVVVIDDLSSGHRTNISGLDVEFIEGSITDERRLREAFDGKPEIVFHLAANFANQNSVDHPIKDLDVNGTGILRVLTESVNSGVDRFIYASSSCVYGNRSGTISETLDEPAVETPYAITKYLGEQYVRYFAHQFGLSAVVMRLFNSYGPGEYPGRYRNVIPNFLHLAMTDQPLTITGDGTETRDFTFVDDTVKALLLAMEAPDAVGMTFNTGTGIETSVNELVDVIGRTVGKRLKVDYAPARSWDRVRRRCSNISRIRDTLGYSPSVDLSEGIERTYEWLRTVNTTI